MDYIFEQIILSILKLHLYGGRELSFVKFTLRMKCEKEMKFDEN